MITLQLSKGSPFSNMFICNAAEAGHRPEDVIFSLLTRTMKRKPNEVNNTFTHGCVIYPLVQTPTLGCIKGCVQAADPTSLHSDLLVLCVKYCNEHGFAT